LNIGVLFIRDSPRTFKSGGVAVGMTGLGTIDGMVPDIPEVPTNSA
jgi:hypothetical protein